MTGEVAELVLRDNYLQGLALSLAELQGVAIVDQHARLIRALERAGHLDREIEFLPDDEALTQRIAARRGLTRPELAVLMAYAKNTLEEPNRVTPAGNKSAVLADGVLTVELPAVSWTAVALG